MFYENWKKKLNMTYINNNNKICQGARIEYYFYPPLTSKSILSYLGKIIKCLLPFCFIIYRFYNSLAEHEIS